MNSLEEAWLRANECPEVNTTRLYWVSTMRGWQPRCRSCDGMLTRGPKGGIAEDKCPSCGFELSEA